MAKIEVKLPKMGESVTEATITNWLKNVGDTIEMDEPLVEVATDKVDNEIPSEVSGKIIEVKFQHDEVAQVGDVIAIIETEGGDSSENKTKTKETPAVAVTAPAAATNNNHVAAVATEINSNGEHFYSPLVKSIASKEGIGQAELDAINGTGKDGRVTKKDILDFVQNRTSAPKASSPAVTPSAPKTTPTSETVVASNVPAFIANMKVPVVTAGPNDEIIEMDRMRRIIADNMVMSKHVSPHVTSFVEADVTNIVLWRNKNKKAFLAREGEKLTFTPIFIEAIVKALKDFPMINVSVGDKQIIRHKDINIGMATALPSGNLIVPVIHNADQLNLVGLAKAVNELADNARNNKLKPEDIQGGTYTVSNVGTFGNVMGTPIIPQPQVAVLAVGSIRKMPAVIETPQGDLIGIRHKMFLSHSYDHRVVDGALGGMFVRRVADYLEQFDINREI